MKIETTWSRFSAERWFDSAICREVRERLLQEAVPVAGTSFRDAERGVEFPLGPLLVSPRPFTNEDLVALLNGLGLRSLQEGMYEVFNEGHPNVPVDYAESLGGYRVRDGYERHPAVGVSWEGASFLAGLLGGRLLTEAEWVHCALSGRREQAYPWGDEPPSPERANYGEAVGKTTPVGQYPPNAWGLYDFAGNVDEWCADWYVPDHAYAAQVPPPDEAVRGEKVVKGGSWNKEPDSLRASARRGKWHRIGTVGIGFRVAWDAALTNRE